jgi:hypothetical protein
MKHWWQETPETVVARIYHLRGQIPPKDWEQDWPAIKEQLDKRDPEPMMLKNQAS